MKIISLPIPGQTFLLAAIFLIFPILANAEDVNLSLPQQQAIPTASDSIEGTFEYLPGFFADGKMETAWVTGKDMQEHWARIQWRNITVAVNRIEIDFASMTVTYYPHKDFFESQPRSPVTLTSVRPDALQLEVHTEGAWKTVHNFRTPLTWQGNKAVITLEKPLTHVREMRLKLQSRKSTDVFAIREWSMWGPKTETSFSMQPKWKGIWIWGDLDPTVANLSTIKRYFRHIFEIKDPSEIVSAKLIFSAYDRGWAYLNGKEIGKVSFPGEGMMPKLIKKDVDPKLFQKGKNLFAILGEDVQGWGVRGVLAELWIQKSDGTSQQIATSPEFVSCTSEEPGWKETLEGFDYWTKANPIAPAHSESDSFYTLDYAVPYPEDTLQISSVNLEPKVPKPGEPFRLEINVKADQPLKDAYGLIARYGEAGPAWYTFMNLNFGSGFIRPTEGLPKGFSGEKEFVLSDVWPSGVPPRLPILISFCNEKQQAKLLPGPVGTVLEEEKADCLKLYVGNPAPVYDKKGFPDVKIVQGGRLSIDGKLVSPILFTSSLITGDRFFDWSSTGIEILRIPPHGADFIVPSDGDEEAHWERLFSVISAQVEIVHALNPNAKFLLYMDLNMPNDWCVANPEEMILMPNNQRIMTLDLKNPFNGFMRATPNSDAYLRKLRRAITEFIKRLETQPYAHSIIGFFNVEGRGGENYWGLDTNISEKDNGEYIIPDRMQWVFGDVGVAARRDFRDWLKQKYKTKEALTKAWKVEGIDFDDIVNYHKWPNPKITSLLMWHNRPKDRFMFRDKLEEGSFYYDFVRHQNEARAELHIEAGKAVKEASGGKLLCSGYIGYVVPGISNSPPGFSQHSGHTALQMLLESPYVDHIQSPITYHLQRGGDPVMPLGTVDSLRLHGKLWMNEYDTHSYLSPTPPDKTYSQPETIESFQKHFAYAITKDTGWWWYEFPFSLTGPQAASWFSDPQMLKEMGIMKRIYDQYLTLPYPGPSAECAVILNVEQAYHTDAYSPANTVGSAVAHFLIPKLFKLGPAIDIYAQTDLPKLIEKGWHKGYKLMLFVNAYQLTKEERSLIENNLKKDGRTLVFFFAPGFQGNEGNPNAERSVKGIEEVTGMRGVHRLSEQHLLGLTLDAKNSVFSSVKERSFDIRSWFSPEQVNSYGYEIGPIFYLSPPEANGWIPLATLRLDGKDIPDKVALAQRKEKDYQVFYSTLPDIPLAALRFILNESGAHSFTSKSGVLVWSNPYFLCVHGTQDEKGLVLNAKEKANWIEPFEKKLYGKDTSHITIDLKKGETKFFCLEKQNEWQAFLK